MDLISARVEGGNCMLHGVGAKRMPVILSRSNELQWIKASNHLSDILRLLSTYPAEKMNTPATPEVTGAFVCLDSRE